MKLAHYTIEKSHRNIPIFCKNFKFSFALEEYRPRKQHILQAIYYLLVQRRRHDFGSGGGNTLGGRPRRGSGSGAPQTLENFRKISKDFLRK